MESTAFLFDVDGVLSNTPHLECWRLAAIDWHLIDQDYDFSRFYEHHISGESGIIGALRTLNTLGEKHGVPYFQKYNISTEEEKKKKAIEFRNLKQKLLVERLESGAYENNSHIVRIAVWLKYSGFKIGVVSASESAASVLKNSNIREFVEPYETEINSFRNIQSLYELFDIAALGIQTSWNGQPVAKSNHYAMAYGRLLEHCNTTNISNIYVFEDAPKSIEAVKNLGFIAIGIHLKQEQSTDALIEAGASIVYATQQLQDMSEQEIFQEISNLKGQR